MRINEVLLEDVIDEGAVGDFFKGVFGNKKALMAAALGLVVATGAAQACGIDHNKQAAGATVISAPDSDADKTTLANTYAKWLNQAQQVYPSANIVRERCMGGATIIKVGDVEVGKWIPPSPVTGGDGSYYLNTQKGGNSTGATGAGQKPTTAQTAPQQSAGTKQPNYGSTPAQSAQPKYTTYKVGGNNYNAVTVSDQRISNNIRNAPGAVDLGNNTYKIGNKVYIIQQ